MKRSTKFVVAAVAALGLAAVAVPVVAQQGQMLQGGMMGHHGGMMMGGGMMAQPGGGMMGGGMMGMHGGMMGAGMGQAMAAFDTDKDGTISPEELAAGVQGELKTYDTDGNGALSLEEFAAMHAAHTRQMMVRAFQMHDADGDAQVTEAEMAEMADMMSRHMQGGAAGMPGMVPGRRGN
jgi:hypothetical protein